MNKITLTQALTGTAKPIKQLRWQYDCQQCGRDNGMAGGYPLSVRCVGFGCDAEIEAADNPDFVLASTENSTVPTGDQSAVNASRLTLQIPETAE